MFRLVHRALFVFALLAAGAPALAQFEDEIPLPPKQEDAGPEFTEAERYAACIRLAGATPEATLDQALAWRDRGASAAASHCVAIIYIALDRHREAAEALEAIAEEVRRGRGLPDEDAPAPEERPPLIADLYGQAGNAWLMAGDPAKAENAFTQAVTEVPERLGDGMVEFLIDRARARGQAGAYRDALKDLDRAQLMAPERADIFIYRAAAFRGLDDLPAAAADVENALRLSPDQVDALLERANVRHLTEDYDGAREDWLKILELQPGSGAADAARANLERFAATPE
ncbi:MAG: hypothetical protein MI755_15280 [Sphingomonadales bacterium]|nr:hypothetical protein [Sphingomonadales bacterium]